MADDAHGVNVHKNREASVDKKRGGRGSDVELRRESAYDSNGIGMVQIYIRVC